MLIRASQSETVLCVCYLLA